MRCSTKARRTPSVVIVDGKGCLLDHFSLIVIEPFLPAAAELAVLAGLLSNVGVQLVDRAYAAAEAQALGVLEFTALPWAARFGWVFFGEAVRPQVWAGAAVIFAACLVGRSRISKRLWLICRLRVRRRRALFRSRRNAAGDCSNNDLRRVTKPLRPLTDVALRLLNLVQERGNGISRHGFLLQEQLGGAI